MSKIFSLKNVSKLVNFIRPAPILAKNITYGQTPEMKFDVFGSKSSEMKPVIIFWHGGSWSSGSKDEYRFVAHYLTQLDALVVMVDYPKYPDRTFPGYLDDCRRAIATVMQVIERYGGDPSRLFTMGHSSGAHLAAIATMQDTSGALRGCITLAIPCTISEKRYGVIFGDFFRNDMQKPQSYIGLSKHRFLLIHGSSDKVVKIQDSSDFASALSASGQSAELMKIQHIGHMRILTTIVLPFARHYVVGNKIRAFVHSAT